MSEQVASIGRVVHFVYGDTHYAALITGPNWHDGGEQSLIIFPPQSAPFWDVAPFSVECSPGTWHWPEYVPPVSK
jgi:hypothetical protein